jgi:hypothetical protein
MPVTCFASSDDPSVTGEFAQILACVQGQAQFFPEAKAEFAADTDGWLIAFAKARNLVLVTQEVLSRDARRKVPIPNVCEAFGVTYVDTFESCATWRHGFTGNAKHNRKENPNCPCVSAVICSFSDQCL